MQGHFGHQARHRDQARADELHHAFGQGFAGLDPLHQQPEFRCVHPSGGVYVAQDALHLHHRAQQALLGRGVTKSLADVVVVGQTHHHQCQWLAVLDGALHRLLQVLLKHLACEQAGERILCRQVVGAHHQFLAVVGDVAQQVQQHRQGHCHAQGHDVADRPKRRYPVQGLDQHINQSGKLGQQCQGQPTPGAGARPPAQHRRTQAGGVGGQHECAGNPLGHKSVREPIRNHCDQGAPTDSGHQAVVPIEIDRQAEHLAQEQQGTAYRNHGQHAAGQVANGRERLPDKQIHHAIDLRHRHRHAQPKQGCQAVNGVAVFQEPQQRQHHQAQ